MKSEILSVKEKIGYGMGDAASHIIFDNVMLYMMFFHIPIFSAFRWFCWHHVFTGACA
ncbi:Inner membrane symporter yicJ [Salmonella enterica subsp. enterica]|uniref:Inner membrane symporter yicJ n=1 Tax=Salmonella enterica I TaxID=59201 RepID=A0A379WJX1_SALET|nr:Inner membrane symporter yicJ [Salmonella enterica subsp. enterica]